MRGIYLIHTAIIVIKNVYLIKFLYISIVVEKNVCVYFFIISENNKVLKWNLFIE